MRDRRAFIQKIAHLAAGASALGSSGCARGGEMTGTEGQRQGGVLAELLARNRTMHPGAGGTNHCSMALLSLAALGATESSLRAYGEGLLRKQSPLGTKGPSVNQQTWRSFLGQSAAMPGLFAFFSAEVARGGLEGTLRSYLPHLIAGCGSAEFHCMIRTAYGARFEDPAEVAMGLGYWVSAHATLGPLGAPGPVVQPLAALDQIRRSGPLVGVESPHRHGPARMRWVATLPGFAPLGSMLQVDDRSLAAIAAAMVRLYIQSGDDFAALHAVTATHAYRVLEPFLGDRLLGRRYLWQAMAAYYISMGAPAVTSDLPSTPAPPWRDLIARATTSLNDHSMKLADTARAEFQEYGDPAYLHAAAFRLKML